MYKELDRQESFQHGKTAWKNDHPNETLKHYKTLYIKGHIDSLPWENYQSKDNYTVNQYSQNSEQNEQTLFNKLQRRQSDNN